MYHDSKELRSRASPSLSFCHWRCVTWRQHKGTCASDAFPWQRFFPCVRIMSLHSSVDVYWSALLNWIWQQALSYKSGHSLMCGKEHSGSGCVFRTGSKCLISSIISSIADALLIILISFVSWPLTWKLFESGIGFAIQSSFGIPAKIKL